MHEKLPKSYRGETVNEMKSGCRNIRHHGTKIGTEDADSDQPHGNRKSRGERDTLRSFGVQ